MTAAVTAAPTAVEPAERPAVAPPWTCPFCPLLCDAFQVDVGASGGPLHLVGSDCPRAEAALARFSAPPAEASPTIDGVACSLADAIGAGAAALAASRQPLFGGLGTDVAGARALYALACRTGAVSDPAGGTALMTSLRALQDRGGFTTTLAEVRNRADLIVCLGDLPTGRYPELFRRCGIAPGADHEAHVVWLGGPAVAACRAELTSQVGPRGECIAVDADLFDTLARLAVAVDAAAGPGTPVASSAPLPALAARLRAARYAVLVYDAAGLPAHGALAIETIGRIVASLNRSTRAAALPLGGADGAGTVNQVYAWLSGLPLRSRAGPAGLEHEPFCHDAGRLIANGGVDALLWVASYGTEPPPPDAALPRVVLGHPALAARLGPAARTVFIPVGTPGIGSAGHLFRVDGSLLMPLRAAVPDRLPTVAAVVGRLIEALAPARPLLGRMTGSTVLRGGRVIDPANGVDEVRDLYLRDGRIAGAGAGADAGVDVGTGATEIDVAGCIVLAGGIDMHTHIGGGKVNLARLLLPEDHRRGGNPIALPVNPLELPSCGTCSPGTLATGYRYVEMGYTAAFEPAMVALNARHAHMEMGDIPILDHGAYVMLGNDELLLQMLAEHWDFGRVRDYIGWTMNAAKAMGVKVVNPGGISAFKFNQRKLDVDEPHAHWQVTPRQVLSTLARGLHELGVPHPLHIHGSNLGVAGNIASTLETIDALEGLPGHLTHIQFHAYGTDGPKKFSSAALELAEAVNANKNVSIDVGQIMFGQTVTASGDTMRQHAQSGFAHPRKWIGADIECEAGCGVVPFKYREASYVNALQWAIGLEIFLLVDDPWRVVLTTDHPNGGPFTSYPHLIRLLMDKSFRDEQLAKLHPDVAAQSALRSITRELSLTEIAIMTRAAPARLLGLADRGQLGPGAAADIAVYRDRPDREAMFATPEYVFKDGTLVARGGSVVALSVGGTHFVEPHYDRGIEKTLRKHFATRGTVAFDHVAIGNDELCACGNGGRLLPAACFAPAA